MANRKQTSQASPRALRWVVYAFVASIAFDAFAFSELDALDNASQLLGLAMVGIFLATWDGRLGIRAPDQAALLFYFLCTGLTELYRFFALSPSTHAQSLQYYKSYLQVFVMYVVIREACRDVRVIRTILKIYFVTYTTIGLTMMAGLTNPSPTTGQRVGFEGFNLNQLAFMLSLLIVGCVCFLLAGAIDHRKKLLLGGVAAAMTLSLAGTGSRGGSVTLALGLAFALVLHIRVRRLPNYLLLVPGLVVGLVWVLATSETLVKRFEDTLYREDTGSRVELAKLSFRLYEEHPIMGYGPHYVFRLGQLTGKERIAAHNTYLQNLLSFGCLGFLPFLLALGLTVHRVWLQRKQFWGGVCLTLLFMLMVFGMSGNMAYDKTFWILLAIASRVGVLIAKRSPRPVRRRARIGFPRLAEVGS